MAPAGFKTPEGKVHVKGRGRDAAKRLLDAAKEAGIDASEIVTTSVGYLVPEALVAPAEAAQDEAQETASADSDTKTTDEAQAETGDDGDKADDGDTPDDQLEAFDPSKHTVDEVAEYLAGADDAERDRVISAENESAKPRKGVLDLATTGKEAE